MSNYTAPTATSNFGITSKNAGDAIDANTFKQMLSIINALVSHEHTVYDDYTSVCNCNCACDCDCGRGIV